jgi:hypothetical protein
MVAAALTITSKSKDGAEKKGLWSLSNSKTW